MRTYLLALILLCFPVAALAAQKPAAQTSIGVGQVLRGSFSEVREMGGSNAPFVSSGHFVIAPDHGLIWGMERPMATSTIVTANAIAQDIGGLAIKLPAKNLQHVFHMVSGAIMGDWTSLESDFVITPGGSADHWTMALTPNGNSKSPYASITITGSSFVETIVMTKKDGTHDTFGFNNAVLSTTSLTPMEAALFQEVRP
jgi:hypothetical protein